MNFYSKSSPNDNLTLFDANSLLLCLRCCLSLSFLPTVCYLYTCFYVNDSRVSGMHSYNDVFVCLCCVASTSPGACLIPPCPYVSSHPLMATHLYKSDQSLEIDSSDGMISDASTKDSSSSDEESRSSDDDDGGDSD